MRLGMFMMPLHPPGRSRGRRSPRTARRSCSPTGSASTRRFVGEHVTDLAENVTSSMMFLASVAHDTKRIVLGTGTLNMPNAHPAAIAAQVAMLDHMLRAASSWASAPAG